MKNVLVYSPITDNEMLTESSSISSMPEVAHPAQINSCTTMQPPKTH